MFSFLLLTIDDLPCPSFGFSNLSTRVDCYTIDSDGFITIPFHRKGFFFYIFGRKLYYSTTTMLYCTEKNERVSSHKKNQCHPEQCDNQA